MNPSSLDLRQKIVAAVDSGLTQQEVADRFDVSTDTVARSRKRRQETGTRDPLPVPERAPLLSPADSPALVAQLDSHPDATLEEHGGLWQDVGHARVSPATRCRTQQRINWTRKRRP